VFLPEDFANQVWHSSIYTQACRQQNVAKGHFCRPATAEMMSGLQDFVVEYKHLR